MAKDKNYQRALLLYNLLETLEQAADGAEEMETDAGTTRILSFKYEPTIEFFEDDVKLIDYKYSDFTEKIPVAI